MHKILEILKKHWVPIAAIGGGLLVWIYLRRNQSASTAPQTLAQGVTPQYYTQPQAGGGVAPSGNVGVDTTGTVSATQPGTSSSGVSSSTPTIIPYISPSQTVSDPSNATQAAAAANPYATNPNPGSDPFNIAPQVAQSGIAAFNGPTPAGTSIISAIQAILTGKTASNPSQGATTIDPALANTLHAASLPGGLAALPSNNPYLTSSSYENLQKSILNGPGCCEVDSMGNGGPNSPCCQVSTATGEIATGAPTAASKVYQASVYCEGNNFNAGFFGTAPDNGNCNGANPNGNFVGDLIGQYIPQPSAPTGPTPGSAIGGLPPNWNSLTRDQQDAWAKTGMIPAATNPVVTTPANNTPSFQPSGGLSKQTPGAPIVPSHPGSGYLGVYGLPDLQQSDPNANPIFGTLPLQ